MSTNLTTTSDMNMDLSLTTAPPIINEAQHCQQLSRRKRSSATEKRYDSARWVPDGPSIGVLVITPKSLRAKGSPQRSADG
ncbi:hypothetical protein CEXT_55681 [Caerostris extrusa]|uniref:Uncharacterized protein n=1 Tax=Caerostris extrusa TaxID=172846 RepID=A0AAV4MD86_CAEEX|nr:hypothetical protein CEXT_55681 [Caerostris extrusa]